MQYTEQEFHRARDIVRFASGAYEDQAMFGELASLSGDVFNNIVINSSEQYKTACLAEDFAGVKLSPIALGQLLMETIDSPDDPVNKAYWLQVAEHIGPDYAQALYHAAVFTTKVA